MQDLKILQRRLREALPRLTEEHSVESLELFGSYVRGEQKEGSDLDVLVTFREAPGLIQFIRLEDQLSELLGVQVDLVMKDALKKRVRRSVLQEAVVV